MNEILDDKFVWFQQICQNDKHIQSNNNKSKELFFLNSTLQQNVNKNTIICSKCRKNKKDACCELNNVKNELNQLFKLYHFNQALFNIKSNNSQVSIALRRIYTQEDNLFDGFSLFEISETQKQSQILSSLHLDQFHSKHKKVIQLLSQSHQILKDYLQISFFDILSEPQIKIIDRNIYRHIFYIKERNIIIAHNESLQMKAMVYNYQTQKCIKFNVEKGIIFFNNNFVVYQYVYKEHCLKIINLSTFKEKMLMKLDGQIQYISIIKDQLWLKYYDLNHFIVIEINIEKLSIRSTTTVQKNKVDINYAIPVHQNYLLDYYKDFVDIRTNRVILTLGLRYQKLRNYDESQKRGIFQIDRNKQYLLLNFNFICKKILRKLYISEYWIQINHQKYLAYIKDKIFKVQNMITGQEILSLTFIDIDKIQRNKKDVFHVRQDDQYSFWIND